MIRRDVRYGDVVIDSAPMLLSIRLSSMHPVRGFAIE